MGYNLYFKLFFRIYFDGVIFYLVLSFDDSGKYFKVASEHVIVFEPIRKKSYFYQIADLNLIESLINGG